ncbi:hypothetical protein I568_01906 [Enterococcus columbae DSM 7374 = ATCC 51263]|uniref:Uncharacterized protein n=1 Tax=Enterococcus columbae DSM 7374 = ATCC 51263 TaxID=1121865 RepID=S0KHM8_9ENTE|nr:hypothetical protein OMW_01292 [Enterococcus columbae DSM 7374 = ATCC 51263]EOW80206.1 hypothetical protein I568_01906 [Enterococcus columbae DSM 7374 = ATCC 51263]
MGLNLSDLGLAYIVCGKTDLRKGWEYASDKSPI